MTRFFDIVFSAIAIAILLPFMIPVMIGLKLTGEHYIFYSQSRVGRGGQDFPILKFATMLKNSPNLPGGMLTQKNDSRILPMGTFLRKMKINELPQLLNILVGQMSFVGPRPQVRQHYNFYAPGVRQELDVMAPGLTGVGSLMFRDEEVILNRAPGDRSEFFRTVVLPYKGELEVWYARHKTLWKYFIVIFSTAWVVLRPRSTVYRRFLKGLPETPHPLKALLT